MLMSILSIRNYLKKTEISNIVLFLLSSCISLFGTSIYNFAISLYVLKLTGSGLSFAITQVLGILSTILVNPFAGVLVDRLDKKRLAIIMDFLCSSLLIGLYLLSAKYALNLFMIYAGTFLLNVFTTVYGICVEAAKPNLVSEEKLISINSISKIIDSSASILGPMIGGIVFAFLDMRFFIVFNGISFAISSLLQLFVNFKFNFNDNSEKKESVNFFDDFIEGITYLKDNRNLSNMFGVFIVLNFFMGLSINVPMPYIINNVLKLNTNFFGIIEAALPVGMILGALIIIRIMSKYPYIKIIKLSNILLSVCMFAIGLSVILYSYVSNDIFFLIYYIIIMLLAGIAISSIDIPIFYTLQITIPDVYRGRVLSIGISITKIILPISLVIAGALVNHIPAYILPIASSIGLYIYSKLLYKLPL